MSITKRMLETQQIRRSRTPTGLESTIDFDPKSIEEMVSKMSKLSKDFAKKAPSSIVRAASKPIIKEMRKRAPVRFGYLKKSLGVRVKSYAKDGNKTAVIGARSKTYKKTTKGGKVININPANYSHLVEFGTSRHSYRSIFKKAHPGATPKPFMRPAWSASTPAARREMVNKATQLFEKYAKQQAVR